MNRKLLCRAGKQIVKEGDKSDPQTITKAGTKSIIKIFMSKLAKTEAIYGHKLSTHENKLNLKWRRLSNNTETLFYLFIALSSVFKPFGNDFFYSRGPYLFLSIYINHSVVMI